MSTGLKNAGDVIKSLSDDVQFAVNEECAQRAECDVYKSFVEPREPNKVAKPVFHIEYVVRRPPLGRTTAGIINAAGPSVPGGAEAVEIFNTKWPNATTPQIRQRMCLNGSGLGNRLSTVIKEISLNGWVMYCDGSVATTRVGGGGHEASFIPSRGGKRIRVAQSTSDASTSATAEVEMSEIEEDPDHSASSWTSEDPDVAAIILGHDNASDMEPEGCCDNDVWDQDVGPIYDDDLKPYSSNMHKGAGKDRIGPNGPVQSTDRKNPVRRVRL
jgi:hypothetical protein